MAGIFGNGNARAEAAKQAASARRSQQASNEEAARSQQQAERGGSGGRGRNMMLGSLTSNLKKTLGG